MSATNLENGCFKRSEKVEAGGSGYVREALNLQVGRIRRRRRSLKSPLTSPSPSHRLPWPGDHLENLAVKIGEVVLSVSFRWLEISPLRKPKR